jgi:ketosteroid isomerase-like protein
MPRSTKSLRRALAGMLVVVACACGRSPSPLPASGANAFDAAEIQAAMTKLLAALESPDRLAWVYMYTEDAGLLEAGSPPIEGRAKLLELARTMQPMSSTAASASRVEGHGTIAYWYGTGSWVNGRPPQATTTSRVHLVIVWRKEGDGQWRVAQEVLVPDQS